MREREEKNEFVWKHEARAKWVSGKIERRRKNNQERVR